MLVDRYEFDRELRLAIIEVIDRLEVAIRSVMANRLSVSHSPHWFIKTSTFKPSREWGFGQLLRKTARGIPVMDTYGDSGKKYSRTSWAIFAPQAWCITR